MKKRYVRYRLVAESSIIKRGRTQPVGIREDDTYVWNKPGIKDKTAYQLLEEAVKIIAKSGADTTWLVYTAMKKMGGTIITLIKDFIKKLPGIAVKIFNFVKSLVEIFWNTFGKRFLNLLKGLAAICATFLGVLSDALGKVAGGTGTPTNNPPATTSDTGTKSNNPNGTTGGTGATTSNVNATSGKTGASTLDKLKQLVTVDQYSSLHKYVNNQDTSNKNGNGEPQSNNYVPNFILGDRAIRILNEATNNPGAVSRTLDNWIEKAKPRCRNLCYRCVKSNVVETNPQLASMIGASTILICGYSRPSGQFTNLQNNTGAKKKLNNRTIGGEYM